MLIAVSPHSPDPLYLQIVRQIQTAILTGALMPGEGLPSLRQLALDTGVSLITTKRAYEDLEAEGWVVVQPGRGTVVATLDSTVLDLHRKRLVKEQLSAAYEVARKVGLDRREADLLWARLWEEE